MIDPWLLSIIVDDISYFSRIFFDFPSSLLYFHVSSQQFVGICGLYSQKDGTLCTIPKYTSRSPLNHSVIPSPFSPAPLWRSRMEQCPTQPLQEVPTQ